MTGAAALIVASEAAVNKHDLTPLARVLGGLSRGVQPRIMGMGPAPATEKLLTKLCLRIHDIDVFEFNEAFAAQVLARTRSLGLSDDAEYVNPNGGAIALGHPLGATGARLVGSLALQLKNTTARRGLAAMCVGVGQGIAVAIEAV